MQRPAWTIALIAVWLLILPGLILTHYALVSLLPSIQNLPENVVVGIEETLRLSYLKSDSEKIKTASTDALGKCNAVPVADCNYNTQTNSADVNVKNELDTIRGAFDDSLTVVQKFANDPYFGVPDMQETADSLNDISNDMKNLPDEMKCYESNVVFCKMHSSADDIVDGMSQVNEALDQFKNSDLLALFVQYSDYLVILHAFPYILVLGMLCLTFFWSRSHKGCCPHGLCYIPFILFWLVNFAFYLVVAAVGVLTQSSAKHIEISTLKNKPTIEEFLTHIQTEFKDFWDVVFLDMMDGLQLLLSASFFYVAVALLIILYSFCLCCCRPYKEENSGKADGGYRGPANESTGRDFIAALRAEYVNEQGAVVGDFLDKSGVDPRQFEGFEESIRAASNREQAINDLAARWGV